MRVIAGTVSSGGLLFWMHWLFEQWCNSWHGVTLWFAHEQLASQRRSEWTGHCLKWHSACFPQMSGTKKLANQIAGPPSWVTDIPWLWLPTPTTLWWGDPASVKSPLWCHDWKVFFKMEHMTWLAKMEQIQISSKHCVGIKLTGKPTKWWGDNWNQLISSTRSAWAL